MIRSSTSLPRVLAALVVLFPALASAQATSYPTEVWASAAPSAVGMDEAGLRQARDLALSAGGSGLILRHGVVVYRWGSETQRYEQKSGSKSFSGSVLALAIGDGRVALGDRAQTYLPGIGVPPQSNADTGWLDEITVKQLASHWAGFGVESNEGGGYSVLARQPGTGWNYSDSGVNWLGDLLTVTFDRDLYGLLRERVFGPMGMDEDLLTWRRNAYRSDLIEGIVRREAASGIEATVDAMARNGLLYLKEGRWRSAQLIPASYVQQARKTAFSGKKRYGLLWWNNSDNAIDVPTDTFWAWGHWDTVMVVVPSLDLVIVRAGTASWQGDGESRNAALSRFLAPIVDATHAPVGNAAPVVDVGPSRSLVLPQTSISFDPTVSDDGRPGGALTYSWRVVRGTGVTIGSPATRGTTVTFPRTGRYVLELAVSDGAITSADQVTVTVGDLGDADEWVASSDTYTLSSDSTTPHGAELSLSVSDSSARTAWIGFPSGAFYSILQPGRAILELPVARVTRPGTVAIHRVTDRWDEATMTDANGTHYNVMPVATIAIGDADEGGTVTADVTTAVARWTSTAWAGQGFAIVPLTAQVEFASRESGQPARLRMVGTGGSCTSGDCLLATTATASPATIDAPGGSVTFRVNVRNIGDTADSSAPRVTIESVTDSLASAGAAVSCAPSLPASLTAGQSLSCSATRSVNGTAGTSVTDSFTVRGRLDDGTVVTSGATASVAISAVADTTAPVITLLGANPQTSNVGDPYRELGATAADDVDGNLSAAIAIDASSVNTARAGRYSVSYSVSDRAGNAARATRTVEVVATAPPPPPPDTTAPVITLKGANPQIVDFGSTYVELGATASDGVDGDLTGSIVVGTGGLDTRRLGSYPVTYDVKDAAGNAARTVTRTVQVVDRTPPVITLSGADPQRLTVGGSYSEAGAKASDDVDGDLSAGIRIDRSALDTSKAGTYSVRYDVADRSGNAAPTITRQVIVEAAPPTGGSQDTSSSGSGGGGRFDLATLLVLLGIGGLASRRHRTR